MLLNIGFFKKYKEDGNKEFYIKAFNKEVLSILNSYEILVKLKELSGDKIPCLICYEKPSDFCHRHLVANWLYKELNIITEEFQ